MISLAEVYPSLAHDLMWLQLWSNKLEVSSPFPNPITFRLQLIDQIVLKRRCKEKHLVREADGDEGIDTQRAPLFSRDVGVCGLVDEQDMSAQTHANCVLFVAPLFPRASQADVNHFIAGEQGIATTSVIVRGWPACPIRILWI